MNGRGRWATRRRGFALVLTLGLVALLVLLALALAGLGRVDAQMATTAAYQTQARQNALLGLGVALGRLQELAGPDARVTAPADVLAGRDEAKAKWTGVWASNGTQLGWLVSGENPSVTNGLSAPEGETLVSLVGPNSAGSVEGGLVQVSTLSTASAGSSPNGEESGPPGRFAYWVGDEGTKATVRFTEAVSRLDFDAGRGAFVPRKSETTDAAVAGEAKRLRQMMQARPRPEQIDQRFEALLGTGPGAGNLLSFEQIREAASGVPLANYFHDLTLVSRAVLSDPVSGGLKRDLSDPAVASDAGFDHWLKLRPDSWAEGKAHHWIRPPGSGGAVAPVVTEFGLRFSFFRNATAAAANGSLAVHCQMQVELWNPFTSALEDEGSKRLRFAVSGLPRNLTVSTGSGVVFSGVDLQAAFDQMTFELPAGTVFSPGAVAVFYGGSAWSGTATGTDGLTVDFNLNIPGTSIVANRSIAVEEPPESAERDPFSLTMTHGGLTVATYRPDTSFARVASLPTANWQTKTNWQFGYGFALRDAFSFWADGAVDGMDPKRPAFFGAFVEADQTRTIWRAQPEANATAVILRNATKGSAFYSASGAPAYFLFELPRQEVVSLGALQHFPGDRPNAIGNPWGGPSNAVFDRFFLSAFQRSDPDWLPTAVPLGPNAFLSVYPGASPPTRAQLLDGNEAARHLLIEGAFNVNSTSERAWRAILGGAVIPENYTVPGKLEHAFFRHSQSAGENSTSASKPTGVATARRQGVREISESSAQIAALAGAVATLNRNRSRPFLSVAEFLTGGTLARALDPNPIPGEPKAADRAGINGGATLAAGMPSYLSQADLLTMIAPFVTARSDTFRIRAYGNAVNPASEAGAPQVEATAICEAMVQRVPDLLDPARPEFGRRFVVTYFRWLGPDDI